MTTVYLAPGPFGAGGQFFGLGGLSLNLGTITTYAAGSTTPLATYTTSAGSVLNANPIVLGTDGRPPNEIWITGDSYRFDLKDSLGNLIKTYDDLSAFNTSAALVQIVDTIALLKALTAPTTSTTYLVRGYYTVGDSGGGTFIWNSSDTSTDNGGTIIAPNAGGTGRWNRLHEGVMHTKWFGAKHDDSTNDFSAILACVNAAAATTSGAKKSRAGVHIDSGLARVSSSACLTPTNTTLMPGINFTGNGWYTSIIRVVASGSDIYFFNNGSTGRSQFDTFEDIGFEGADSSTFSVYTDISDNAKAFRLFSDATTSNHEQGFKFHRCRFSYFGTFMELAGGATGNTASEIHFIDCKITHIKNTVYSIDNFQSFNHEFHGTDIEVIYGDVFSVGSGGGGAIKMYGGSVIMLSDKASDVYFFKPTGSTGTNAYPFTINGVRFEFRGNTTNFCSIPTTKQFDVKVNDSYVMTTATSNLASFCKVAGYSTVAFNGCTFSEQSTGLFQFHITEATGGYGQLGAIRFNACGLPIDWSDRCILDSFYGRISATDCYGTNIGAPASGAHYAHDFDLHWNQGTAGLYTGWDIGATLRSDGSPTDNQFRLKIAQIKLPTEFWPTNTEQTLKVPKNAIIKALHLRKPAGTADATATTFRISDNTKTTHHLTSNNAAFNLTHTGDVNDYYYHVGAAVADRTLRLNSSAATTGALQGGLAIVEYY